MKIVVTATQPSLDAAVDPRFGRCPYFLIVDTDDLALQAVENPNAMLGSGAGIQSAQLMAEKGVGFVLTGNCGPNACQALSAAGIQVIDGCSGVVRDVVEQFKAEQLSATQGVDMSGHLGTANAAPHNKADSPQRPVVADPSSQAPMAGTGMGRGGRGRGAMGGGRGRRMGKCMGRIRGGGNQTRPLAPIPAENRRPSQSQSKEQELQLLKQQAEDMGERMLEIRERIRQLEEEG